MSFNSILTEKERYISEYDDIARMLAYTVAMDKEAVKLRDEVVEVYELIRRSINENAHIVHDQEEYRQSQKAG